MCQCQCLALLLQALLLRARRRPRPLRRTLALAEVVTVASLIRRPQCTSQPAPSDTCRSRGSVTCWCRRCCHCRHHSLCSACQRHQVVGLSLNRECQERERKSESERESDGESETRTQQVLTSAATDDQPQRTRAHPERNEPMRVASPHTERRGTPRRLRLHMCDCLCGLTT